MVDYSYYKGVYGGVSVNEPIQFTRLSRVAYSKVNKYTLGRLKNVKNEETLEKVKLTICRLVDQLYQIETVGLVKSSSVEGFSVTYADSKENNSLIYGIILEELFDTGLMSRNLGNQRRTVWRI